MQGDRCDLTRLQADCGHHWCCSWDQDGISKSVCHWKNVIILWLNWTTAKTFLKITPEHEKGRDKATNGKVCEKCCSCLVSIAAPLELLNQKVAVFSV